MDKPKFECRVCGSKKYEEVKTSNGVYGPGGRSWTDHYICSGCSVIFKDVEKFSKK